MTDIDRKLREKRERGILKNVGKRRKYFLTCFDDILYSRTRYKDRQGKAHYLVDEALSIKKNQHIRLCRAKIECFLASLSSYREVVEGIRFLIGCPRCHESIRQSVIKEVKLIIKNQEEILQRIRNLDYQEGNPPDTAYIET
jgi:hypothetical protein